MSDWNERAAKCMGWKEREGHWQVHYYCNDKDTGFKYSNWNPLKDLNQAMMLVEKLPEGYGFNLRGTEGSFIFEVLEEDEFSISWEFCENPAEAIVKAVVPVLEELNKEAVNIPS